MEHSRKKIDAIYEVREAAEEKARAERVLAEDPSDGDKRDRLLDAQMALEEKTVVAVEICHECGHAHERGEAHTP
jgi:hypothetical protein